MKLAMKVGWLLAMLVAGTVVPGLMMRASSSVQCFVWGVWTGVLIAGIAYSYSQRREKRRSATSATTATGATVGGWDGKP